ETMGPRSVRSGARSMPRHSAWMDAPAHESGAGRWRFRDVRRNSDGRLPASRRFPPRAIMHAAMDVPGSRESGNERVLAANGGDSSRDSTGPTEEQYRMPRRTRLFLHGAFACRRIGTSRFFNARNASVA